MKCYCNSNKLFNECCKPIILGKQIAKTAEILMRSRYSAYVVANVNFLLNSHHPLTRPTSVRKSILKWTKSVHWLGLEIIAKQNGLEKDSKGYVEFKASFMNKGNVECIHENSYFVKNNNQWFYKSGTLK